MAEDSGTTPETPSQAEEEPKEPTPWLARLLMAGVEYQGIPDLVVQMNNKLPVGNPDDFVCLKTNNLGDCRYFRRDDVMAYEEIKLQDDPELQYFENRDIRPLLPRTALPNKPVRVFVRRGAACVCVTHTAEIAGEMAPLCAWPHPKQ